MLQRLLKHSKHALGYNDADVDIFYFFPFFYPLFFCEDSPTPQPCSEDDAYDVADDAPDSRQHVSKHNTRQIMPAYLKLFGNPKT